MQPRRCTYKGAEMLVKVTSNFYAAKHQRILRVVETDTKILIYYFVVISATYDQIRVNQWLPLSKSKGQKLSNKINLVSYSRKLFNRCLVLYISKLVIYLPSSGSNVNANFRLKA